MFPGVHLSENERMSPKKKPFEKEISYSINHFSGSNVIFQKSIPIRHPKKNTTSGGGAVLILCAEFWFTLIKWAINPAFRSVRNRQRRNLAIFKSLFHEPLEEKQCHIIMPSEHLSKLNLEKSIHSYTCPPLVCQPAMSRPLWGGFPHP